MNRWLASVTLAAWLGFGSTAAGHAAPPEPVLGAASAQMDEPGSLTPLGHGRFAIEDRVYLGRSVVRSIVDDWATCLTGAFTSTEDWTLDAPRMTGRHQSTVTIRSDRALVTLRLRGTMELPTASGTWEIAGATGRCSGMAGDGSYTATFADDSSSLRLTFEGQIRS